MNILVTVDENYLRPLIVMLKSLAVNNPGKAIDVYVMSRSLKEEQLALAGQKLAEPAVHFFLIRVEQSLAEKAPVSSRYPLEIYDRLFAASYLPDRLHRILYLDPDLIVMRSLEDLWKLPMGDQMYAAASHVGKIGEAFNSARVDADQIVPYINTGVLLMNLDVLREEQEPDRILSYISSHKASLLLPDQDIIAALYGKRILKLDPYIYNMTERLLARAALTPDSDIDSDWVNKNTRIFHYIGRNKPWKPHYKGKMDCLYHTYDAMIS